MAMKGRWTIEWFSNIPVDENGDADWDRATEETRSFATKGEALNFARELLAPVTLPLNVCTICREEREINEDLRQHEKLIVWEWVAKERAELSDAEDCVADVKLERILSY